MKRLPHMRRLRAQAGGLVLAGLLIANQALAGPVEVLVTDAAGRPLPDAVVFLESPAARAAAKPLPTVEVVQLDRQFQPAVSIVTPGTSVSFPNRDAVRHHVYSFSPVKRFEIKLYVGTPAEPVVFDQAGIAVLGCNIHDKMAAWVVIVDTPWFGKTDATGRVSWPAVPKGRFELRTWHADLPVGAPAFTQPLSVETTAVQAKVRLP